jgi:putative phosphoribosyl transferase
MRTHTVRIPPAGIEGDLAVPPHAKAVILFAHGSGSSRFSSRNRFVAHELNATGFGTLLLDLLTPEEDRIQDARFNIPLLAERLVEATDWLKHSPETKGLAIGYFGASTGSAAALMASVKRPEVFAVVSRGGRPDLAEEALPSVKAPTLLIVGGADDAVLDLNRSAESLLGANGELIIVARATHLFEEPGALEEVAELAERWFGSHLHNRKPVHASSA